MPIEQAVILSAGKGSRLYPYTEDRPKCLLDLSGRSLLEWQLDTLNHNGIRKVVIVTGFRHDLVEQVIAARGRTKGEVELVFNPFFQVADNLGSVWIARQYWDRDTLLLNGDTVVSTELVGAVLASETEVGGASPITVTIDRKAQYDADDMKVLHEGNRLVRIGKVLDEYNAESVGFIAFRGRGGQEFIGSVEMAMRTPEGVRNWYLLVVDKLAQKGLVGALLIEGNEWQEVDYLSDLDAARALTSKWAAAGQ